MSCDSESVDVEVSPDGERLFVLEDVEPSDYDAPIVVVSNGLEEALARTEFDYERD